MTLHPSLQALLAQFTQVRQHTLRLVEGLTAEDCMVQSMPEASPVKWHLAHTTWFFETFVLEPVALRNAAEFQPFDVAFRVLFNSYYVGVGERHARPARGVLSRPGLDRVLAYRRDVEQRIQRLLEGDALDASELDLITLGIHHEQQHQELIQTDVLHHFSCNPLLPAYRPGHVVPNGSASVPTVWVHFAGGATEIGHAGAAFAFDNECPRHTVWLTDFALASRPVTNGQYLEFVRDGGYQRPELWLSDGWDTRVREGWEYPLYWRPCSLDLCQADWQVFGGDGLANLNPHALVCHLSYYEAEAFARWAKARLPTEAEWEHAAQLAHHAATKGAEVQTDVQTDLHRPSVVWQWTQSAYLPYPGFIPAMGAVGEYNGKFMVNQMVLRGGSVATPDGHVRRSYRNFFPPATRWQFAGLRLAHNL